MGANPLHTTPAAEERGLLWRVVHHPQRRDYALAVLVGLVSEGLLAVALYVPEGDPAPFLPLLFLVQAVVLGGVFGPGPGMVGAVAPLVLYFVVEWGRRALGLGSEPQPEDTLGMVFVVLLYCALVFAFLAGMTGAIRNRYFRDER